MLFNYFSIFVEPHERIRAGAGAIDDIITDLKNNPLEDGEQFNLSGYSYGSVLMAQASIKMLNDGQIDHIDNLILIGTPINRESPLGQQLAKLEEEGKIGKVHYENAKDDQAEDLASKTGIPKLKSILSIIKSAVKGDYTKGHLMFAGYKNIKESNDERKRVATNLKESGVE